MCSFRCYVDHPACGEGVTRIKSPSGDLRRTLRQAQGPLLLLRRGRVPSPRWVNKIQLANSSRSWRRKLSYGPLAVPDEIRQCFPGYSVSGDLDFALPFICYEWWALLYEQLAATGWYDIMRLSRYDLMRYNSTQTYCFCESYIYRRKITDLLGHGLVA